MSADNGEPLDSVEQCSLFFNISILHKNRPGRGKRSKTGSILHADTLDTRQGLESGGRGEWEHKALEPGGVWEAWE